MTHLVLVTRPLTQSRDFAEQIASCGAEPVVCPLLAIIPLSPDLSGFQPDAVIVTSSQVFSFDHDFSAFKNIPLFCVGKATAQRARAAGFLHIHSSGDVRALIEAVMQSVVAGGRILYLRGEDVSLDLAARYPDYVWSERILYRADPVVTFPDEVLSVFDKIHTITLFSRRSAVVFTSLIRQYGLEKALKNINLLSLSAGVLDSAKDFDWRGRFVAQRPDTQSMIAVLTTLLQDGAE